MSVNCNVCGCDFDGPHVMDPSGEAVHQWNHECVTAIRAALAAAEAKLADERRYALVTLHALAGCVEWMGEDGCDCGSDDPRCALCEAQAVIEKHAARRAAEAANG